MQKYETLNIPTDRYYPEPRCCCGFIRARDGAAMIGMIQLVLGVLFAVSIILFKTDSIEKLVENSLDMVELAVVVIMLCGLKREDYLFLIPYLVFEVCFFFLLF